MPVASPPQPHPGPPDDSRNIADIIREHVALHDHAGTLRGTCPFCQSTTFNVRPSYGTFHCFGCGIGGDAHAFLLHLGH